MNIYKGWRSKIHKFKSSFIKKQLKSKKCANFAHTYNKMHKRKSMGNPANDHAFLVLRFLLKLYNYLNFCSKFKIIIKYIILQKEKFLNRWGTIKFP